MGEWKKCKISDCVELTMGQSPSGSDINSDGVGVPFLQGNRTFGSLYPAFDTWTTSPTRMAKAGDVIMSVRAPVGDVNITPVDFCLGRGVCSMRMFAGDQRFLYYLIRYNHDAFVLNQNGTIFGSVNREDIKNLLVAIPDSSTQSKIAAVLGALDDKIENNRKICANLEAQAQAIFKSWFVDFEPFGGKMPQGWKMGKLGDIIESMLNGDWGKDTPDDKNDSPVYCVRGADIPDVVCGNKGKMPLRYILPKNYETKQLANGDVVIEISGGSPTQSTGRAALITDSLLERYDRGMVCTNFCKAVKPRDGFSFLFYNYWCYLYNKGVFFQYENGTTGIKNLDIRTALNELDVVLPVAGTLSKFTDIVSTNFKLICKLGLETEKLAATRDALLPQLMSGEIDVEKVKVA